MNAAPDDYVVGHGEVHVPGHRSVGFEGIGRNDLEGRKHDGGSEGGVGHLFVFVMESAGESFEHAFHVEGDAVGGEGIVHQAGTMAGGVGEEESEQVIIFDGHWRLLATACQNLASRILTSWQDLPEWVA